MKIYEPKALAERGASGARVAELVALTSAGLAALYRIRTYDTLFHLAAGQLIRAEGALPAGDPFSFSFPGAAWLNHSSLFQRMLAELYALGGFAALSVYQALAALLLLAITLSCTQAAAPSVRVLAALLALVPYVALREVLEARPHMLGFVCLALTLKLACEAERSGRPHWLWPIVPIYAAWVSSHGSHVIALVVLALGVLCAALARAWRLVLGFAVTGGLCLSLMAALAPWALEQGLAHTGSLFLESTISEWRPVTGSDLIGSWPGRMFAAVWLATAGAMLVAGRALARPALPGGSSGRLYPLLLTLVFLVLALSARRMTALLLFAAAPLWVPLTADLLWRAARRLVHPARGDRVGRPLAALGFVALLACACAQDETFRFGLGLHGERFPSAAVAALREAGVRRVYNAYNYGGYLMWQRVPVLVDGRAITIYPPDFLEEFQAAYRDLAQFDRLAQSFACDAVLMPTGSALASPLRSHLMASSRWRLQHRDAVAELYVAATERE